MEKDIDYFAMVESLDTGKCIGEATLQIRMCIDHYRYYAGCIQTQEDLCVQHNKESFSMVVREPIGIVALILPWNAPIMLLTWKLAPALAAGNCVVIKPASNALLPVLEIASACQDFLPPGVINVVSGSGSTIGNYLVEHEKVGKISFTGATETGIGIGEKTGRNITPCTLELGGKSANIVFPDASINRAIQYSMIGILSTAGEVCVAGSRLLLHQDIYNVFLEKLVEKFKSVKVGNPLLPDVQMGPVIDEKQMNTILKYIEAGKQEGARLVCGGRRLTGGDFDKGFFVEPTIFSDVDNKMKIAQEEIFGPVLVVEKFTSEEEAISLANDSRYGLGAAVWSHDLNRALRVSSSLEAGIVWVNDYLNSPVGAPFGGMKKSGIGREWHKNTIDQYSCIKNICVSTSETVPDVY
jgi:acyl-CoA reductase-like NAD-dependent aldehyde dehydrogenase